MRNRSHRCCAHAVVWRFRDGEVVPLICPTCQVSVQTAGCGGRRLLCMGLFSTFLLGAAAIGRDGALLKPHRPSQAVAETVGFGRRGPMRRQRSSKGRSTTMLSSKPSATTMPHVTITSNSDGTTGIRLAIDVLANDTVCTCAR